MIKEVAGGCLSTGHNPPMVSDPLECRRGEMRRIIDHALVVIDGFFAHLHQKSARYAFDAMQALRLLALDLESGEGLAREDFDRELMAIFARFKDSHTRYLARRRKGWSHLPFRIERHYSEGEPRYLITGVAREASNEHFKRGVEVTHWNGTPIARVVEQVGERYWGAHREARLAQGLQYLAHRPQDGPPPDEEWVTLSFLDEDRKKRRKTFRWSATVTPRVAGAGGRSRPERHVNGGLSLGFDEVLHEAQQSEQTLLESQAESDQERTRASTRRLFGVDQLDSTPSGKLWFGTLRPRSSTPATGYVRIWDFDNYHQTPCDWAHSLQREFLAVMEQLPQEGLILDLRGNAGGVITAAEALVAMLTQRPVEPTRFQFRSSKLALELCRRSPLYRRWYPSLAESVQTGDAYSQALPLLDEASTVIGNPPGRYDGPVVLIVDALCYSAADIFAASFRDHEVGEIIGVDSRTGAGGANVWSYRDHLQPAYNLLFEIAVDDNLAPASRQARQRILDGLRAHGIDVDGEGLEIRGPVTLDGDVWWEVSRGREKCFEATHLEAVRPGYLQVRALGQRAVLPDLPAGVDFTFAARRALRSGDRAGLPLEDVGVECTVRYFPTRRDLLEGWSDLLYYAAERLRRTCS